MSVTQPVDGMLSPGETTGGAATHVVTQADLDAGSITNTASAEGAFAGAPVTSSTDSVTVNAVQASTLTLDKSAAPASYDGVGDVIVYTYSMTNNGNTTLVAPFGVVDDRLAVPPPAVVVLAPGATTTTTATHTVTQADLDAGSIINTASAGATFAGAPVTSNTDSVTVSAVQAPVLTLAKSADRATYALLGETVTYTYVLTNTGNVTLAGPFVVADDKVVVTVTQPADDALSPGETTTGTATHAVTQADLDAGSITNSASGAAVFGGAPVTSNSDSVTLTAVQGPALELAKSADRATFAALGETVTYAYVLRNSGTVTLAGPFTVSDDKTTVVVTQPGDDALSPGETTTGTATYTIMQADLDSGVGDQHRVGRRLVRRGACGLEHRQRHGGRGAGTRPHAREERCPHDLRQRGRRHHLHLHADQHGQRHTGRPLRRDR